MTKKHEISSTMCAFPWMHLHSWPDGKAMLCCIAHGGKQRGKVGDFSVNSFQEIINNDKMKQVRVDLMNGVKIKECEACWKDEALGKKSMRKNSSNDVNYDLQSLLDKTHPDGTLDDPKILYMDFRFSNLCNLGCKTCGSPLSSTIANKKKDKTTDIINLQFKNVLSERGTITSFVYARPDFLELDVIPYLDDCKEFYFAGGEPLMHQEHLEILKYLDENKHYNKHLVYSTNLTLTKWKGTDFISIWKKFNKILFWCSIDGHKDQLEYIREYSNHDKVFSNLESILRLKEANPVKQFKVKIAYTHSIYNAYYVKEFFQYLYDTGLLDRIDFVEINYAFGDNNSPAILPAFAKKELKEKRKKDRESDVMQYAFKKFGEKFINYYDTLDTVIDEQLNPNEFDRLIKNKLEADKDKIEKALPWLASVIQRHKIA